MSPIVKEKQIKRHTLYTGKVVDLHKDDVVFPDGSKHIREVVGHKPAVAVVPMVDNATIIMIRQYRYVVGKTLLEIPAGLIDSGEQPRTAAKREVLEETGYKITRLTSLGSVYSSPGFTEEKIFMYMANDLIHVGEQNLDHGEHIKVEPITLESALAMIEKGQIVDGKTIQGILLTARRLGR